MESRCGKAIKKASSTAHVGSALKGHRICWERQHLHRKLIKEAECGKHF